MNLRRAVALMVLGALLPACGGSGGTAAPGPQGPVLLGVLGWHPTLASFDLNTYAATPLTGPGMADHTLLSGIAYDPGADVLYVSDTATGMLLKVDPVTGAVTPVGPMGCMTLSGLAWDPTGPALYGIAGGRSLVTLDRSTGESTVVGRMVNSSFCTGIAFAGSSLNAIDANGPGGFYDVNPATGLATLQFVTLTSDCLAYNPNTGMFFARDKGGGNLLVVDPVGQTYSGIGPLPAMTGLAYIPGSNRLLGVQDNTLYEINPATGATTRIAELGLRAPEDLAYDPVLNRFYGVSTNATLYTVDPATAARTVIGPLGTPPNAGGGVGLAFDTNTRTLFASDSGNLWTLNPLTGAATLVGAHGGTFLLDLAVDSVNGTLWGCRASGELVTVDRANGVATDVGAMGVVGPSLAFDSASGTLYAADSYYNQLFSINPTTGASTLVGSLEGLQFSGLDYNSADQRLYGVNSGGLFRIHPASAAADPVNMLYPGCGPMAWDPMRKILYCGGSLLFRMDPATGQSTMIGTSGVNQWAMAFDRDADVLYGMDFSRFLFRIDTTTGAQTGIGLVTFFPQALAYHPKDHCLYALGYDGGGEKLYRIDPSTGASTEIGVLAGFDNLTILMYHGIQEKLVAYDANSGRLVTIDTATAVGTSGPRIRLALSGLVLLD